MITSSELGYMTRHAYVPEHLPHYVTAISHTEPFLVGDFVVHLGDRHMVFVGYPLNENFEEKPMVEALKEAKARFQPETISIIVPTISDALDGYQLSASDVYYRIELSQLLLLQKTRNMLTRAEREISISIGQFGKEHKKLIDQFVRNHHFEDATKYILQHLRAYCECASVLLFEARNTRGHLVAFDVAEFGALKYAFYMFNFRSHKHKVPGASDLLLAHMIERAKAEDKRYVNLGLGINPGIAFFKKKWGATPFLSHVTGMQATERQESWTELLDQLSGF